MAGTIICDRIESDASFPSSINIASPIIVSNTFAIPAGSVGAPALSPVGDTNTGIYFPAADAIGISTNGVDRIRVTSAGNVGIGTSSPNRLLTLSRDVSGVTNFISLAPTTNGENDTYGIEFTNPVWGNKAGIYGVNQSSGNGSGALAFYTQTAAFSYAERMRIDSSGNLLVGTTSAPNRLYVKSTASTVVNAYFENSSASPYGLQIQYTGAAPNNTDNEFIYCADTANNRFIVYANGNVANRNNSYGGISDAKLKENIVEATPKLDKLNQVRVVNFNMIGETHKQIGVVAQELEQIFPGMVEESPDRDKEGNDLGTTTKSVKYSVFVPMLIKAIQEQQAIIDELKARLDAANL